MNIWAFATIFSLLFFLFPDNSLAFQCGEQNNGTLCAGGLCCSKDGWCGTTDAYCGAGCQSQCDGEFAPPPPESFQCGWQANGTLCAGGLCCSSAGYCGTTEAYCGTGCQSQCHSQPPPPPPPPPSPPLPPVDPGELGDIISKELFEEFLLHRNDDDCPAKGFYTYEAFILAAQNFPGFGTTGDEETRKREIAAFFGQTSHEITGGAPGDYTKGYCFLVERDPPPEWYCDTSYTQYPCVDGKEYYGRGPIQLSWNYNYGLCGEDLGLDLLKNPDLVATDPVISFETAIWFWMTPQSPKPSCHDVMVGNYVPTQADIDAGRLPGYGLTTNIINGGIECGKPDSSGSVANRIGYYKWYCEIYGVDPGENLDCENQKAYSVNYNMQLADSK